MLFKKNNYKYSKLYKIFTLFIINLLFLSAEERTVTLTNGTQLTAKTYFGNPARFHNNHIKVTELRPVLGILQEWRESRISWTAKFLFWDSKARGMVSIESLVNPGDKSTIPIYIDVPSGYNGEGIIMEFFNKSTHPSAWNFLSEPGDSWIPFNIKVILEEPKASFSFIEWARVTEKEKSIFLSYENAVIERNNNLPKQSLLLADGSKLEIKIENGAPVRYSDPNIQVDYFCPAFDANTKNNLDPWIWVMTGKTRGLGPCRLEIMDTSIYGKCIADYQIKGHGGWNIVFAEKSMHPEFWQWENSSKDEWVTVKIRLTIQATGETKEWFESCLINKLVRKALTQHIH